MQIIPSKQNSQYREDIELDGTNFILIFSWNALNEFWSVGIYDGDLNPIVLGIKIVTQFNLTQQLVQVNMPLGDILCQNIVGFFEKIERNDMGQTNELIYYAEGELTA